MEKVGIFDIESNEWNKFEVLGFFDGIEYSKFESINEFLNYVNKKKYDGYTIYAHNGGRFDFLFILERILKITNTFEMMERQSAIINIRSGLSKCNISFADSYALLPAKLIDLTKTFDVEHKKIEFDVTGHNSKKDRRLLKYLENDCIGLYEVLEKFRQQKFIENPKLTIASQALDTFKNRFCRNEILQMPFQFEDDIRRNFYVGGRVEMYKCYGENLNYYDVNSLYPYAMNQPMPCGEVKPTRTYKKGYIGFYHVKIKNMPQLYISPLVVKKHVTEEYNKNFYVNGEGQYCISSAMIEYLQSEFNCRIQIESGFYFMEQQNLLSEYVDYFYKMKNDNKGKDATLYYLSKLFLNSLYGKFAQKRKKDVVTFWNKNLKIFKTFYPDLSLVMVERFSQNKFILPALASYITELARIHHFKLMNVAPNKMYYCDTDSLVSSHNYGKYVGTELGKLSYDGCFDEGVFLSPKSYALQNEKKEIVKFKGFNSAKITFKEMKDSLFKGLVITQTKQRLLSFRECLKRVNGIISDEGRFLKVVNSTKESNNNYTQRQIFKSSRYVFDTFPLQHNEVMK
jgi:hypothetical protein